MLSTINPYGLGNIYQKPQVEALHTESKTAESKTAESKTAESQIATQTAQEIQELPSLSQNALEIRKFSDGIKGANEMVGAMQIADITLNALSNQIKSSGEDLNALDASAKAAQFKGEALFGKELTISLAGESVSLSLPLPSQIQGNLSESFANKHQEISDKMGQISGLIEKSSLPFSTPNGQNFDFENFDPSSLKGIFS
ncbi:flagellar FLiS export co-chaperone [Helicobacter turcicus]|uniref:Flagellar FLiS export co-chaperone n=1 Tax=Helicobacter turcicus TaxID=2867412 RepID=A0ABS7JKI8_9HELI|nr:flagellar FLiS export co-chaperone [Helicobacter turcicus]MBX7489895.1 flagellar FLiS export co-chaperone [Helicobacter turcicus]MBX7544755.1 flagellar FLiS export co-chaperone [Helicobacter turcicus]